MRRVRPTTANNKNINGGEVLTLFVGWGVGFNVGLLDGCCHKEMQILRITLSLQMGMRILLFHLHWELGCLRACGKGKDWDLA